MRAPACRLEACAAPEPAGCVLGPAEGGRTRGASLSSRLSPVELGGIALKPCGWPCSLGLPLAPS